MIGPDTSIIDLGPEDWRDERERRLRYHGGEVGYALHVAAQHGIRLEQQQARPRASGDSLALTLTAAARRLGVSKETLRRQVHEGAIRTVKWVGRTNGAVGPAGRVRVPLSEVERIAQEGFGPVPKAKAPQPKPRASHQRIKDLPF
jgi:excisionase family DNA binding protein